MMTFDFSYSFKLQLSKQTDLLQSSVEEQKEKALRPLHVDIKGEVQINV